MSDATLAIHPDVDRLQPGEGVPSAFSSFIPCVRSSERGEPRIFRVKVKVKPKK